MSIAKRVVGKLTNGLTIVEEVFPGPVAYQRGGQEYIQVGCNKVEAVLFMDFDILGGAGESFIICPHAISRNLIFYRMYGVDLERPSGGSYSGTINIRVVYVGI